MARNLLIVANFLEVFFVIFCHLLLILDEATNALDNLTEDAVMRDLINSNKNTTIMIITPRINTVKKCDNIFLIDKGEIKGEGNFKKLIEVSDKFRETADKSKIL